jgi:hypothetical protein
VAPSKKWSDHAVEIILDFLKPEEAKEMVDRLRAIDNANASVTMTLENIDKRLEAKR